jgi:hypothetical protein
MRLVQVWRNNGHYVVGLLEVAADVNVWELSIPRISSDFCRLYIFVVDVFFVNEVEL